jgi:hypothetical protein
MQRLRFLTHEIALGTLIALLSIFTAVSSYQSSIAGSEQTSYNVKGMQALTNGNADYLTANQEIIQDYTYFDSYYLNFETNPTISEYYEENFSDALTSSMKRSDGPFDEPYYEEMYAEPFQNFVTADEMFVLAEQFNKRGDQLQLVMLIMAVGLSFAAWASLLAAESKMRLLFAVMAVITLVVGVITYLSVPNVIV